MTSSYCHLPLDNVPPIDGHPRCSLDIPPSPSVQLPENITSTKIQFIPWNLTGRPVMRSFDVFFIASVKNLSNKQLSWWCFETPWRSCDVPVILCYFVLFVLCTQMETFSALLALCEGNSLVTGEFPSQRPVTRSFDVFYNLRLNKRFSKQSWGWWFERPSRPLWCHCNG